MTTLYWITAIVLVLLGLAGTVLPALPGAPLVFAGMLLAAWIDSFQKVGGATLTVLAVLTIISFGVDIGATALGAKSVDASRQALAGAVIGTVIGLFGGLAGLVLGPFIGAALGEFIARRDLLRAGTVGAATTVGLVIGSAAKLALCFCMVGLFITAFLWK